MKFVGLVGSNYDQSYNRKLLEFIRRQFKIKFELEVLEIDEVPMFNQDCVFYITKSLVQMVLSLPLQSTTIRSLLPSSLFLNGFLSRCIHLKTNQL